MFVGLSLGAVRLCTVVRATLVRIPLTFPLLAPTFPLAVPALTLSFQPLPVPLKRVSLFLLVTADLFVALLVSFPLLPSMLSFTTPASFVLPIPIPVPIVDRTGRRLVPERTARRRGVVDDFLRDERIRESALDGLEHGFGGFLRRERTHSDAIKRSFPSYIDRDG
jgi:hypothetical protein